MKSLTIFVFFDSLLLVYMMTQKGDPYVKMFSTSSGVILMSCFLSQLNILCNNLIKPHFTKMTILPVIHRSHVTTISRVLQRIGFDQSGVIHISKRATLYLEQEQCF